MSGLGAAAAAAVLAVGAGLLPTAPVDTDNLQARICGWRLSAAKLHQELQGQTSPRAQALLGVLNEFGVNAGTFVPARCKRGGANGNATGRLGRPRPGAGSGGSSGGGSTLPDAPGTGEGTTAAAKYGWGTPNREDDFGSEASIRDWSVYDGPGHGGNGRRSPSAVSIAGGVLTLTGDSSGTTAGMAWSPGQRYGRWEARVKAPASDPTYHALLLLWPDAEDWPVGGEVDFMEMMEPTRRHTKMFLHYGADNSQLDGSVDIDGTQWHNWAVEWGPDHIAAFVDGREWWRTEQKETLPPGPMHLTIQLDWFPGDGDGGDRVRESTMHVDWVRQYPYDGASGSASSSSGSGRFDSGSGRSRSRSSEDDQAHG